MKRVPNLIFLYNPKARASALSSWKVWSKVMNVAFVSTLNTLFQWQPTGSTSLSQFLGNSFLGLSCQSDIMKFSLNLHGIVQTFLRILKKFPYLSQNSFNLFNAFIQFHFQNRNKQEPIFGRFNENPASRCSLVSALLLHHYGFQSLHSPRHWQMTSFYQYSRILSAFGPLGSIIHSAERKTVLGSPSS